MTVFTLSGLWHGANWTYVLWGVINGAAVSLNALTEKKGEIKTGVKKVVCQIVTFAFWTFSLVLFRSDSLKAAGIFFGRLFSFSHFGSLKIMAAELPMSEIYIITKILDMTAKECLPYVYLIVLFFILAVSVVVLMGKRTKQIVENCTWSTGFAVKMTLLFVWAVISLSGVSTFLYFNF